MERTRTSAFANDDRPVLTGESFVNPPHSITESTLAPTSEFARNFLLAIPSRYIMRGSLKSLFSEHAPGWSKNITDRLSNFFYRKTAATKGLPVAREYLSSTMLETSFGLGALALTGSYARMVYNDMFHMFRETVAYETGKDPAKVTFSDIRNSNNAIVSKTVDNFYWKTGTRAAADALFFAPALMPGKLRWTEWGEMVLGLKGMQMFAETWKREPTLFEHITALVHSKINPKNGLGQPINTGEVFDLYQHYQFQFDDKRAFKSVVDTDANEARIWAGSQPIFERLTKLLNLTYSYKHKVDTDQETGQPIIRANFPLPKFIYLLGHNMIDPTKPEQTMLYIESANRYGIEAVKDIHKQLSNGASLEALQKRYPVTLDPEQMPKTEPAPVSGKIGTKPTADLAIPANILAESTTRETNGTLAGPMALGRE